MSNRTLVHNAMWAYLLQATNLFTPLLLLPLLTRALGVEGYGTYNIALNWVTYFSVLVAYGFDYSGARKCSVDMPQRDLDALFSAIVWSRLVLLGLSLLGILAIALSVEDQAMRLSLLFLALVPVSTFLAPTWLFIGTQRLKFMTIATLLTRLPFLGATVLLVDGPEDVPLYSALYGTMMLITGVLGAWLAARQLGVRLHRPTWPDMVTETRDAYHLFVTNMLGTVHTGIGVTVLAIYATAADVGAYSGISRIALLLVLAYAPIGTALYPVSCSKYVDGQAVAFLRRLALVVIPTFVVLSLVLGTFSQWVVAFALGSSFQSQSFLLIPLLLWVNASIAANLLGVQGLAAAGAHRTFARCAGVGVGVTVAASFLLVPQMGASGAAWAAVLGEGLGLLTMLISLRRVHAHSEHADTVDVAHEAPDR